MRVETLTDESGRRVVEKRADSAADVPRLRREADFLQVATHPGLVELVQFEDGPEPRLRTGFLGGRSLDAAGRLEVEEIAGVVAALASTVADLHGMGLVHGAVASQHVLLDEDGRPVLCSPGYGGLAGERPPALPALPPSFLDRSRDEKSGLGPGTDVFGIGAILRQLLAERAGHPRRATVDALETLADRALAPTPSDRPTARALADAVHDTVLGARLPRVGTTPAAPVPWRATSESRDPRYPPDLRTGQRPLERWRERHSSAGLERSRIALVLPVMAVLAVVAGVVRVVVTQRRPQQRVPPAASIVPPSVPQPAPAATAIAPPTTLAPVSTTLGVARPRASAKNGCAPVEAVLSADVDGDGCAEALRFDEGVLDAGRLRWAVGQPGDLVATGDWSCSGTQTLALLRPATGEVFAFEGWATGEQEVRAPLVERIPGGRTVRAADLDGDGCHELVVERTTGAPVMLRVPAVAKP